MTKRPESDLIKKIIKNISRQRRGFMLINNLNILFRALKNQTGLTSILSLNKKSILTGLLLILMINLISAEEDKAPSDSVNADSKKHQAVSEKLNNSSVYNIKSPDQLLGLSPEEAYSILGAPSEVFSMRGESEWQDDVVFYYSSNIYLFWFKNRVWQIRADKRFKGTVLDLKQGMSRNEVNKKMGKPFKKNDASEIYMNPKSITRYETGYPVRLKIFYDQENLVSDIYVYRGDF